MNEAPLLLTAVCPECRTTVSHQMACACPNWAYLNQDRLKDDARLPIAIGSMQAIYIQRPS